MIIMIIEIIIITIEIIIIKLVIWIKIIKIIGRTKALVTQLVAQIIEILIIIIIEKGRIETITHSPIVLVIIIDNNRVIVLQ